MARKIGFGKAVISDSEGISSLTGTSSTEICTRIRDYFVARFEGKVVGTINLSILSCETAQISCLSVQQKGEGIGSRLVELALYDAKLTGVKKVILSTEIPEFFKKFRFKEAKGGKGIFMEVSLEHLD